MQSSVLGSDSWPCDEAGSFRSRAHPNNRTQKRTRIDQTGNKLRIPAQVGHGFQRKSAAYSTLPRPLTMTRNVFLIPRLAQRAVLTLIGATGGRIVVEWVAGIRGIRTVWAVLMASFALALAEALRLPSIELTPCRALKVGMRNR